MISKLIVLCCIIFILALSLFIIIKKKDEIKAYIKRLDEKINNHNEKVENKKKASKSIGKQEETNLQEQDEEKGNKVLQKANKKNSSNKDNANEENNPSSKLKPSKAVEQTRPILLPANYDKEKEDIKLLEMKKTPEQITSSPQKALNFNNENYLNNQNMVTNANNSQYNINRLQTLSAQNRQPSFQQKATQSQEISKQKASDFIGYDKDDDNFNPLKRDIKKQYDDIKNFIELPDNQEMLKNKGVSYDGKSFNVTDKIDASLFNSPEGHYVDYRKPYGGSQGTRSSIINNVNRAYSNNYMNFVNNSNNKSAINMNNANSNVYSTSTKYSPNGYFQNELPNINLVREQQFKLDKNALEQSDTLTPSQEEIDLNRLPNNLKKLIIQNILDRKNYD